MSSDITKAIAAAKEEANLCRRMLAKGSPPAFWRDRLESYAEQLRSASDILRAQAEAIELNP
jgi:hypothetical protein